MINITPTPTEAALAADTLLSLFGRQNFKARNTAIQLKPAPNGEKNWIRGLRRSVNTKSLTQSMLSMDKGFGIAHADYSNSVILDLDEILYADIVESMLRVEGLQPLVIETGKGLHFWVCFNAGAMQQLVGRFGSGIAGIESVAKYLRSGLPEDVQNKTDLRGFGNTITKCPLTWEPKYGGYVFPRDCNTWASAIKAVDDRHLNDLPITYSLYPDLTDYTDYRDYIEEERGSNTQYDAGKMHAPIMHDDGVETHTVGEGESNEFVRQVVKRCKASGMPESEVPGYVANLYDIKKANGTFTGKDRRSSWVSKAKGRAKYAYSHNAIPETAPISEDDFKYILTVPVNLRRTFAVHVWYQRMARSIGNTIYYISGHKQGIVEQSTFSRQTRRLIEMGYLTLEKKGHRAKRIAASYSCLLPEVEQSLTPLESVKSRTLSSLIHIITTEDDKAEIEQGNTQYDAEKASTNGQREIQYAIKYPKGIIPIIYALDRVRRYFDKVMKKDAKQPNARELLIVGCDPGLANHPFD